MVRVFWALSGKTQKVFARETGVHPVTLNDILAGAWDPSLPLMDRFARAVALTVPAGEQILQVADALRQPRVRAGSEGFEGLLHNLGSIISVAFLQMLRLPLPECLPRLEDRKLAREVWDHLQDLSEDQQVAVVRLVEEFQNWALVEICCEESEVQASRDLEQAACLARVAREIAERVRGPEGWRNRIRGYAWAHGANIRRVVGELKAARTDLEVAKRLWQSGSDPEGLLDPGRLLDLEASLCRDERRFDEALARLEEAIALSRQPGRVLIKKGFTLEVMGEYTRAIEVLLQAEALPDLQADPRRRNIRDCNLGFCLVHVGRFAEAAGLARKVGEVAAEMGDEIGVLRAVWLEGRVAAGQGHRTEALRLLGQARREFEKRSMFYDVALALLEEAVLLLEEGRTAEVKELAGELTQVFADRGVHREALSALRLFAEAAKQEEATAEEARSVLRFLFRAQHDPELRFEAG